MTDAPAVSVLMTVRNGQRYLAEAIDSILAQTFGGFELIVVDDASDDETPAILAEYAARDERVRILRNDTNIGPYPSANRGLEGARAPLIARMDADDISAPERLARQIAFLKTHPQHLLVATSYRAINEHGQTLYEKRKPADDARLRFLAMFRMPAEHPSFMFRAEFPDGTPVRYETARPLAQDYALLLSFADKGKVAILPEILFTYRVHSSNLTSTRRAEQADVKHDLASAVQSQAFSPAEREALAPLLRGYLLHEPVSSRDLAAAAEVFELFVARSKLDQRWLRRNIAEILAVGAFGFSRGLQAFARALPFAVATRQFLPSLVARYAENRGWLPRALESYPRDVGV